MTQEERRIWLIREIRKEVPQYAKYDIPSDGEGQWRLLRGLFNVRPPLPASPEFLKIQGELLREMTAAKGIVSLADIQPCKTDRELYIWQGDITTLRVDAIVNAANSQLLGCYRPNHSCIDNMIHTMAGVELRCRCAEIMGAQGYEEPTGQAKITPAYNLPSKYVIHTVGPIVDGALTQEHRELLASSYHACLDIAAKNGCESIAFCCISTGVFGFPQREAAGIAVEAVKAFKAESGSLIRVVFDVFKDEDLALYQELLDQ